MKRIQIFTAIVLAITILKSSAKELKFEDISLKIGTGWSVSSSRYHDSILIAYGTNLEHSANIYTEVYSYEQFHHDVFEFLESLPEKSGQSPQVTIHLRPLNFDDSQMLIGKDYPAAKLWNDLLLKLLPAMRGLNSEAMNKVLRERPPYISITGKDQFPLIQMEKLPYEQIRKLEIDQRKPFLVDLIMQQLTPEQRVALDHSAQYPHPPDKAKGDKIRTPKRLDKESGEANSSSSPENMLESDAAVSRSRKNVFRAVLWVTLLILMTGVVLYKILKRGNGNGSS